jgi:hypothetical protein
MKTEVLKMNKEELFELDGLVLTDEEFDNLIENELVVDAHNCGLSGLHYGCTLWDVQLKWGDNISVYTKEG